MKMTFVKGVLAGGAVAVGALASSSALAGTGIGGLFNLGQANTVNAKSTLTGATAGPQLQVTNTGTGTGATGLGINVPAGKPPLTVNSATQVPKLNASLLGGKSASAFLAASGTAANAAKLGGIDPGGYMQGHGSVTGTPGYVAIDAPGQVDLGPVGTLGELWGHCENTGPNASDGALPELRVANAIPAYGALLSFQDDAIYGHQAGVEAIGPPDFKAAGSGKPNVGGHLGESVTIQISYGNEVDTVTVAALDYYNNGADTCDFSAQVVTTTG